MVEVLSLRPGRYNRKNRNPSADMLGSDGKHYRCGWIEDSITIHSDGNISCGLDDPHGQRSFGNIYTQSVEDIFRNPEYDNLQRKLWGGYRCRECGHFRQELRADAAINARPVLPSRLVVETTVTCNLRCPNLACLPNNDPNETTRDSKLLNFDAFTHLIDELSATLKTVNFYNYGEPFMHRRAEEMLGYIRRKCPQAFIVTSTNGIPLCKWERAQNLVRAAPNRVTFTIGGTRQETYGRYHVNGRLSQAMQGLKNVCDAKRLAGAALPQIVWRYLAFEWNDEEAEIDEALALADRYGVDRFSLYLTDTPPGSRSIRLSPGSPQYWKYRKHIHVDHEGELNHVYRCELPDGNGFYRIEQFRTLGRARWTSSRAVLNLRPHSGKLRLALTTNREGSGAGEYHCEIRTQWGQFRIPFACSRWNEVAIGIPSEYRSLAQHRVRLTVEDYWFPAQECGSKDLRCLGVLLRVPDESAVPAHV